MKQEDIKRLWEWCGFVFSVEINYEVYEDYKEHQIFYYPNSPITDNVYRLPEPTLDNLFKYAVPKLLEQYDITLYTDDGYYFAWIRENCSEKIIADSVVGQLEPAEALAQAILKVIEEVQ